MLCTRMSVEEDPYDLTMRTASQMSCSISKVPDQDCSYEAVADYEWNSAFATKEELEAFDYSDFTLSTDPGFEDAFGCDEQLMEF
jgi:hypothetical protein